MARTLNAMETTIANSLSGRNAHAATNTLFDGLEWRLAGISPPAAPHSVFQLLNHMVFWQDWGIVWLGGVNPPVPEHASGGWPGPIGPSSPEEWAEAVKSFQKGLAKLGRLSRHTDLLTVHGKYTRLSMIQAIASHNSYHGGQVALLRQMLDVWPPPSGGVTW